MPKSGTVVVLRVRLTVGRLPLEEVIGVRVPDPQHFGKVSKDLKGWYSM